MFYSGNEPLPVARRQSAGPLFFVPGAFFAGTFRAKNGETLKAAPNEIRMWFTEPIKAGLSTVEVRDAAGKQIDQRDLGADEKEPALVRLPLPAGLGPGAYKVTWSAVAQDLHVAKGSFSFRVAP